MLGMRYIKADPNTYLMQYRHGKLRQAGKGLSFWYFAPVSSLAAIPTASTEVSFAFRELTADFQEVTIQGQYVYQVQDPQRLAQLLNYNLKPDGASYATDDPQKLQERITNLVGKQVRAEIQQLKLRAAMQAGDALSYRVRETVAVSELLEALGVALLELAIVSVRPQPDTSRALEAEAREALLQEADDAVSRRRNAAVENERAIRENELKTELVVEEKRRGIEEAKLDAQRAVQTKAQVISEEKLEGRIKLEERKSTLVEQSGHNAKVEADSRAYGVRAIVEALGQANERVLEGLLSAQMSPEQLISSAFRGIAGNAERIGQLNISPDLLESLTDKKRR
ncbi:MAG: SPFH domain-containing protein [Candidatus Thiodiazotropha sp. (ex Monitilora ramsayi)]|nr:SPFH domain-containing protein [Candidatus Thiodiazotropha sp. (ex Monitilora ramsayi)]